MKEKSKTAARQRRENENIEFGQLARLLPLPSGVAAQLDKASVVRLATAFLRSRQLLTLLMPPCFMSSGHLPLRNSQSGTPRYWHHHQHDIYQQHIHSQQHQLPRPLDSTNAVGFGYLDLGFELLQAMDGFLFVVDQSGKVVYISETVSEHLGLSQVSD
uniref:BHLH domain-containing protein n=1 Tax=Macrostomum lignano TaxID=282301 RepID=A0A1I8I1C5_9PLAT